LGIVPFDPEIVEEQLALGMIASSDTPKIAWDAMEAGLDGPAIRRLGSLEEPTWSEAEGALAKAMEEMHLRRLAIGEAALRFARRRARDILQSGADPLRHTEEFWQLYLHSGYASEIVEFGTLHDEAHAAHCAGTSDAKIREWLIDELKNLLAR
jgi:hypothetical protein